MAPTKLIPLLHATSPRVRLVTVEQRWTIAEAPRVSGPYEARDVLIPYFEGKDREHFVVLHLDSAHRPLSVEVVSVGSLNQSIVHPREVFKGALLANAQAIIAAHNHPSGNLDPSDADRRAFDQLTSAGELLGIKLLDFLIVSGPRFRSLVDPSVGGE
ncbi:MAG: JAB domain-containing protein [Planctomycetes bacterium]|nr:JAB domain-containing protein [Planctomycetota bacterium]